MERIKKSSFVTSCTWAPGFGRQQESEGVMALDYKEVGRVIRGALVI